VSCTAKGKTASVYERREGLKPESQAAQGLRLQFQPRRKQSHTVYNACVGQIQAVAPETYGRDLTPG